MSHDHFRAFFNLHSVHSTIIHISLINRSLIVLEKKRDFLNYLSLSQLVLPIAKPPKRIASENCRKQSFSIERLSVTSSCEPNPKQMGKLFGGALTLLF